MDSTKILERSIVSQLQVSLLNHFDNGYRPLIHQQMTAYFDYCMKTDSAFNNN